MSQKKKQKKKKQTFIVAEMHSFDSLDNTRKKFWYFFIKFSRS